MNENQILELTTPKLINWQRTVNQSNARFKILRCGRRTGKTFFIILDSINLCLKYHNLSFAYVGLTYGHAKDVVWEDYMKLTDGLLEYKNSNELTLRFKNGSRIKLYSWDSIDNMLGKKYHKVYLDECAVAKNLKFAWENVIEPTLLDYHGEAWFTSMPRGKGQFKALIDETKHLDEWQDFHFTSYDNETIPDIKIDLENKRKTISPSVFAQQYLAEFTDLEGRIYSEFKRDDALSECPFEPERYGVSIDFGYNHPLAVYLYALDKDNNIFVLKELYERKLNDLQRLEKIKELTNGYEIDIAVADSEDPIAIEQLNRELDFEVKQAKKGQGSVNAGINIVKGAFHSGRLTISDKCINLIDELEVYSWKIDKEGKETEVPVKEFDDGVDSLRYFVTEIEDTDLLTIDDIFM
jgi:PBSX family phage terminase large subunit